MFLETALIRWMPAYVRLLAYFSNFILLASFLGIGLGCLLATRRRNLFVWFPLVQFVRDRRGRSAAPRGRAAEHVDDLFLERHRRAGGRRREHAAAAAAVHRRSRRCSSRSRIEWAASWPAVRRCAAYVINLLGSLAGVAAFALVSWLELPPSVWFGVAVGGGAAVRRRRTAGWSPRVERRAARGIARRRAPDGSAAACGRRTTASPSSRTSADTVVEVNHIFHQSMAPVAQKEYFYQWPYTVFGDTLRRGADSRRRQRHRRRRGAAPRREARRRGGHRSGDPAARRRAPSRPALQRSARHDRQRRCAALPADDDEAGTTWSCSR